MKNKQKKRFFSFLLTVFTASLFFGLSVNAQSTDSGYHLLADLPTIVDDAGNPITTNITLVDYMKGLFVAAIGLAIVLAVVQLVIGGIEYVAAAVPSAKEDAKRRIGGAVGGLLLILLSWVLLQALNPKLLSVGLNLEKIAVVGQPPGSGGGGGGGTICRFAMPANQKVGSTYPTQADCEAEIPPGSGQICKACSVSGKLDCKTGKCATNATVANAVKNNSSGVNPNIIMSIIDAGEGCNKNKSSAGACGYSQVLAKYRRTVCGLTGTDAQTCAAMQNDINIDINCGAKFLKTDFIPRCGPSITGIASCYNTGKKNVCGQGTPPYCQRVTTYYNTCN